MNPLIAIAKQNNIPVIIHDKEESVKFSGVSKPDLWRNYRSGSSDTIISPMEKNIHNVDKSVSPTAYYWDIELNSGWAILIHSYVDYGYRKEIREIHLWSGEISYDAPLQKVMNFLMGTDAEMGAFLNPFEWAKSKCPSGVPPHGTHLDSEYLLVNHQGFSVNSCLGSVVRNLTLEQRKQIFIDPIEYIKQILDTNGIPKGAKVNSSFDLVDFHGHILCDTVFALSYRALPMKVKQKIISPYL